ncbi:unnamed protein product [Rhizopus microsporus]
MVLLLSLQIHLHVLILRETAIPGILERVQDFIWMQRNPNGPNIIVCILILLKSCSLLLINNCLWYVCKCYMCVYMLNTLLSLKDASRASIMGHSMGGHGALTIYIKNPSKFKAASAFAPIANPINCPWGQKAFSNYLGPDKELWKQYDTVELLKTYLNESMNVLIDVGTADGFLENQLLVDELKKTVHALNRDSEWNIRYQEGYDHSYFFISTFIADHIKHHANVLIK